MEAKLPAGGDLPEAGPVRWQRCGEDMASCYHAADRRRQVRPAERRPQGVGGEAHLIETVADLRVSAEKLPRLAVRDVRGEMPFNVRTKCMRIRFRHGNQSLCRQEMLFLTGGTPASAHCIYLSPPSKYSTKVRWASRYTV